MPVRAETWIDHEVDWDGKNNGGAVVPAGRYTGNLRYVDDNGQPQNISLGNLWVNRLVTRTRGGWQETWIDHSLDSLSTIGRCSSVLGSTPGQAWHVRLLSMSKCNSSAGTDDWAFQAQRLNFFEDDHVSRIISVRIGATGSPVHAGDVASVVVDSSAGTAPSPTWRRVAELGKAGTPGAGVHPAARLDERTAPQPPHPGSRRQRQPVAGPALQGDLDLPGVHALSR